MKIQLRHLILRTRRTTERVEFAEVATVLYGPVSTGKSTVARLVDYCLGGDLERTPALQQEFVAVELGLALGEHNCTIERAADDTQSVRMSWASPSGDARSVNAPLNAPPSSNPPALVDGTAVFSLSDILFHLCGVEPIMVRQRSRDPDSPLIRLSFRDIWWYCYLDQTHLDSSFFRLEDPFRGRKSQDAMRFFTGLHSERWSQLEAELTRTIDAQRSKREAVQQIRQFMERFELGSERGIDEQLAEAHAAMEEAKRRIAAMERDRATLIHPSDPLRAELRALSGEIGELDQAIADTTQASAQQDSLRAELLTGKIRAVRAEHAGVLLSGVSYERCPECGTDISDRAEVEGSCKLCHSALVVGIPSRPEEEEVFRRDLNERLDQLGDAISRRQLEIEKMERQRSAASERKRRLDAQLQSELARYDSAFVESIRGSEREIATLEERVRSLERLKLMPQAINDLETEAGELQGQIDRIRTDSQEERSRLQEADDHIAAIAAEFKRIMLAVSFPGVSEEDDVVLDPRTWRPKVVHGDQEWSFWDTGSGGKKTLFNVCYALAIHSVAMERELPVPSVLIVDSPTKNISEDENPDLVHSLYAEMYRIAGQERDTSLQFLLIDSDVILPPAELGGCSARRMAGDESAPSLIPYYTGP